MPSGQIVTNQGRNVLANMGQTQLRNVFVTTNSDQLALPRKFGVLSIERVNSVGEFAVVDQKTLWHGGVGWVYVANHMIVASPSFFRLVFYAYAPSIPIKWTY